MHFKSLIKQAHYVLQRFGDKVIKLRIHKMGNNKLKHDKLKLYVEAIDAYKKFIQLAPLNETQYIERAKNRIQKLGGTI